MARVSLSFSGSVYSWSRISDLLGTVFCGQEKGDNQLNIDITVSDLFGTKRTTFYKFRGSRISAKRE